MSMFSLSFQHVFLSKAGQNTCGAKIGTVEMLFLKLCTSYSFSELYLCLIPNSAKSCFYFRFVSVRKLVLLSFSYRFCVQMLAY